MGALSGVQQRQTKGREPCGCPSIPNIQGTLRRPEATGQWGAPLHAGCSLEPVPLKQPTSLSPPGTSFKGQQGSREGKAGGGTGTRARTMLLPVWPPFCLVPEVRGPPSPAAALGKPPIPHRSFSRVLHSLSPPQTWAGTHAGFSPQGNTPGKGSHPPVVTGLTCSLVTSARVPQGRPGRVVWRAPFPQRLWGVKAFSRARAPGCRGPQFQPPASLPGSPAPATAVRWGAARARLGAWKPGRGFPGRPRPVSSGPGGVAGEGPEPKGAAGWGRAGTAPTRRGSAWRRPPPSGPARPRPAVLGTAPGRPILTQPESPERLDRSCGPTSGQGAGAGRLPNGRRATRSRQARWGPSPLLSAPLAPYRPRRTLLLTSRPPPRPAVCAGSARFPSPLAPRSSLRAVGLLSPAPNARASSCLKGPETQPKGCRCTSSSESAAPGGPAHWNWGVGPGGIRPSWTCPALAPPGAPSGPGIPPSPVPAPLRAPRLWVAPSAPLLTHASGQFPQACRLRSCCWTPAPSPWVARRGASISPSTEGAPSQMSLPSAQGGM